MVNNAYRHFPSMIKRQPPLVPTPPWSSQNNNNNKRRALPSCHPCCHLTVSLEVRARTRLHTRRSPCWFRRVGAHHPGPSHAFLPAGVPCAPLQQACRGTAGPRFAKVSAGTNHHQDARGARGKWGAFVETAHAIRSLAGDRLRTPRGRPQSAGGVCAPGGSAKRGESLALQACGKEDLLATDAQPAPFGRFTDFPLTWQEVAPRCGMQTPTSRLPATGKSARPRSVCTLASCVACLDPCFLSTLVFTPVCNRSFLDPSLQSVLARPLFPIGPFVHPCFLLVLT